MNILTNIPFKLQYNSLIKQLHIKEESGYCNNLQKIIQQANKLASPKALYKKTKIKINSKNETIIENICFPGKILSKCLRETKFVFPFIATCGNEIDSLKTEETDFLESYIIDIIKENLLQFSLDFLDLHISKKYGIKKTASINPGTEDMISWPVEQQKELFSLFPEVEKTIGVKLTESYMMLPNKSISGLKFPTEIDFHNCSICKRKKCPTRTKSFDQQLYDKFIGN